MNTIAHSIINVNDYLWKVLTAMVEADNKGQHTLPAPTKTRPILVRRNTGERIELFRRHDDKLIFIYRNRGQWKLSDPLARLGRDDSHISGPKAMWKVISDNRSNFDRWAEAVA